MSDTSLTGAPVAAPAIPAADITAARLQLFAPRSDYMGLAPRLDQEAKRRSIDTPVRVCHFLAQLYVESGGFVRFEECLDYATPDRLCEVWPARFPTLAAAAPFVGKPRALAEKVYGGRCGNARPGDGWRFRGSGLIDLTFHDNFAAASLWCGMDLVANPDLARVPATAVIIAAAFWDHHGLNAVADEAGVGGVGLAIHAALSGSEVDSIRGVTRIVNGGLTDLAAREAQFARARAIWKG